MRVCLEHIAELNLALAGLITEHDMVRIAPVDVALNDVKDREWIALEKILYREGLLRIKKKKKKNAPRVRAIFSTPNYKFQLPFPPQ